MQRRIAKRILLAAGVLVALAIVAAICISVASAVRRLNDPLSGISEASVIAYGHLSADDGPRRFIVEEVWRQSSGGRPLTVGTALPIRLPADSQPSALVAFFSGSEDSPAQITAVYGDRVPAAGMSLQKFKELCVAPPST